METKKQARFGPKSIAIVSAGAVLAVAIGYGIGSTGKADATKLESANSELASVRQELDSAKSALGRAEYDNKQLLARQKDAEAKEQDNAARSATLDQREAAVKGAEAQKARNTIADGSWTVGRDIEPGTYTVASPVMSTCYWGIYASGSNKSKIIENDVVTGGRPTVTIAEGQDFESTKCGSWTKQ